MANLLHNVRLFESFSDDDRADLVGFMSEKQFEAGETVCTRGQHGNTMLVVVQGVLSAVAPGKDNVYTEVARLGTGAVMGEMFCIDPAPRPVTMVASQATTVLQIGREDLTRMRQACPRLAAALVTAVLHEVLRRLRTVDERVDRELREVGAERPRGGLGGGGQPGSWDA